MIRRDILKSIGSFILGGFASGCTGKRDSAQSLPAAPEQTDVLVAGGGTAGAIAAIQSARAGASTRLIELGTQLGGTMTTGGVCFPGLFHAWGRQIIAGIGWDLVKRTVELHGGVLPDFNKPYVEGHWEHQVVINAPLYAMLAEQACLEAGVSIHYNEFALSVEENAQGWLVETAGPGVRRRLQCKQIIDCTGGADTAALAGMPRLREAEIQPGSILFQIGEELRWGRDRLDQLYVPGADSSTADTRTKAIIEGRRKVLRELLARRAQPGGENLQLVDLRPETAVRESWRIDGEYRITRDDIAGGRFFEDAVCYSFYPIDLHTELGVNPVQLQPGVVPTVPLRALAPKGRRNFLVAGRSVSSDRLANSSLRVQASCMAMGQAAGAAAALAAGRGASPLEVPLDEIRALLVQNQAIVPEKA